MTARRRTPQECQHLGPMPRATDAGGDRPPQWGPTRERTRMDFEPSERGREFQERLWDFMRERVEPAEQVYVDQLREAGDPHAQPPTMEELKEEARSRGLWNLFHPNPEW